MVSFGFILFFSAGLSAFAVAKPSGHHHHHHHGDRHSNANIEYDFNITRYAHEGIGQLARSIYNIQHDSDKDFVRMHEWGILLSPTAKALSEYSDKISNLKSSGGEECLSNGEENSLTEYKKRLAKVVYDCEAGWGLNTQVSTTTQTLMKTLNDLDSTVREQLKDCRPGQLCYNRWRNTSQGKAITQQVNTLRQQFVDTQVLADVSRVQGLQQLTTCQMEGTNTLRGDVYAATAKLNVCAAGLGLMTEF